MPEDFGLMAIGEGPLADVRGVGVDLLGVALRETVDPARYDRQV
jgi:hypothetical protein